ncbi:hypothetical protein G7068_08880 [Leucobacter viscericola]|uniref:Amidohydrolase-related domain-containing protein n=1 Tax=Leucobacter viscericola TaxID=2714935 RepID=A0A6G7XFT2_9MICO|nr:DUF6282 family protein [Leucobacter viscericola]QIK63299.1 hypothetical protein G7068_08880 [Leucobacter viscericola]
MFDAHVHAGPDVLDRIGDDTDIAQAYAAAGYTGFVLKAHYESTVGRAHAAAKSSGLQVFGGIALNQHCGGVNPSAVAATLSAGGRVVWMPTADSHTQQTAGLPRLCHDEPRIGDQFYALPPVDTSTLADTEAVLALIADHDAVLATGHVSGAEVRWLLEHSKRFGVGRVLLTHPSYTVPGLDAAEIAELAALGGYVEITCYQLLHQPGCTPELLAEVARAAGDRLILSSDAGQPTSPTPPEALQLLIDTLAAQGVDRGRLQAAASDVPLALFAP